MSKYISKTKVLYMFEFLFFSLLILKAPVIGDRWMESGAGVSLEHPLRILFAQVRWFQIANGRVFSNLFSFLVDGYSVYIRAIINASMLVLISFLINKICSLKTRLGILIPFLVSFGVWIEVYYYATTFYVSGALILILWIYIMEQEIIDISTGKKYILLCIFAFISNMWIENLSILLLCIWGGYYLKRLLLKAESKKYLLIVLSGCVGTAFMFLSASFAKNGRLNGESQAKSIPLEIIKIGEVLTQEYILFIFLSVVMLRLLFSNKKKNNFAFVHIILWGLTLIINIMFFARRVFFILSTDPINTSYLQHIAWIKFDNLFISNLLFKLNTIFIYSCLVLVPFCIFSICLIIKQLCYKQKNQLYILFFSGIICFFITMVFMYQQFKTGYAVYEDARIIFIFEIILGLLICLFYVQVEKTRQNNRFTLILLVIGIIFWCQFAFIEPFSMISRERTEIAKLVKDKQRLNEWDYEQDTMYFPAYERTSTGDGLVGKRYNPTADDVYYTILLQYYELDIRTNMVYE